MLTAYLLKQVFPLCADPAGWAQALNPNLQTYQVNMRARLCSFLAQTGYESGQFNRLLERLYYKTRQRLMKVWTRCFPTMASAMPFVSIEPRLISGETVGIKDRLLVLNAIDSRLA